MLTVVDRHVPALSGVIAVGEKLAHEILESEAPLLEDTCFTVLGENHIIGSQSGSRAHRNSFFTS